MAVSDRGQKIYEINSNNFDSFHLKGYIRTYFKDGSLNVSSGVPIVVLNGDSKWIDICIATDHPFFNLFKELSKDNKELYNTYFKRDEKITLRVHGENLQEFKQFCKLDIKIRILFREGMVFKGENDPQYFSEWKFLLDLNRIEFM